MIRIRFSIAYPYSSLPLSPYPEASEKSQKFKTPFDLIVEHLVTTSFPSDTVRKDAKEVK